MDLETVEQLKDKSGHETDENNVGEGEAGQAWLYKLKGTCDNKD